MAYDPYEEKEVNPSDKEELTEAELLKLDKAQQDRDEWQESIKANQAAEAQRLQAIEAQKAEEEVGVTKVTEEPTLEEEGEEELSKDERRAAEMLRRSKDPENYIEARPGSGIYRSKTFMDSGPLQLLRAPGTGVNDAITDGLNLVPGVNLPKQTTFQNGVAEGVRDISAIVLPFLFLKGKSIQAGKAIHASKIAPASVQKLGNDALFKWFAEFGIDIGVGAAVDYTVKQNQEDDNLAGVLKKSWPKFYQWIPHTWATQDGESTDIKRAKNVSEGAKLGIIGSLLEGVTKVLRASKGVRKATTIVPESTNAKKNLKALTTDEFSDVQFSEDPVADTILRNSARQEKELNNLGDYFLKQAEGKPITEPILGVHDTFDEVETAIRTKDPSGIIGASIDQARINGNVDTVYGRLGSVITEAALKFGLDAKSMAKRTLLKGLAEQIKMGGKYSAELASGKKLSFAQIDEAGTRLAEILLDPRMETGDMLKVLDEFKGEMDGIRAIGSEGYSGVMKALKKYSDDFLDLDVQKARAFLTTSLAGQVSDFAEGARLMEGTAAVSRAQDMILDRIEYLMVEKGLAAYEGGSRLAHLNTFRHAARTKDTKLMKAAADGMNDEVNEKLAQIIPNAKNWTSTLRNIARENPEYLKPLMLANEFTDGNVDSMYKLNNFVRNKLGVIEKAFVDGQPEMPSIVVRSFYSNIYNSVLSAFATPIKAMVGNLGGLLGRPTAIMAGALLEGDKEALETTMLAYGAVDDTLTKGFEHLKIVFKKVSTDPTKVGYVVREDIALQNENSLDVLKSFAKASEANGEFGPSAMLQIYENQEDLARHPWLRFGANSMTGLDGFSRATLMNVEARFEAITALKRSGKEINEQTLRQASDQIYKKSFDENGMITDKAVEYMNQEIALNLDSEAVKGLNGILSRFPALKPWFFFPKTSMNMIDTARKWGPGMITSPLEKAFKTDYYDYVGKKVDEYSLEEIRDLLSKRNIPFDPATALDRFKQIRYEIKGRKAIANTLVTAGGLAVVNDRVRGNGHWNRNLQKHRRDKGWQPKTYKGLDGNWYSYEFLGPLGDWLALVADVGDNFDLMTTTATENMGQKIAFLLAGSITSKSVMSNFEPLLEILQGNPAAANKWAASFGNALLPLSSQRNELGRLLNPGLREIKYELQDLIRNRNAWLDSVDPFDALPYKYDWIDGKKVGYPDNWFVRAWNTYSPMKVWGGLSPEKQFLVDIEFDSRPTFNKSSGGVELSNKERAELFSIIGFQGHFKKELVRIMKDAEGLVYIDPNGKKHTGYINIIKAQRRGLISSSILDESKFAQVQQRITIALDDAKRLAEGARFLPDGSETSFEDIRVREMQLKLRQTETRRGQLTNVLNMPVK